MVGGSKKSLAAESNKTRILRNPGAINIYNFDSDHWDEV